MKRNNAQNSSAKKKLIPAVAMFTASAVMLSTATYAWFTLNKEVQVTGLTMQATASDGLEISLGSMGTDGKSPSITAPGKDDLSWKRAIEFADYYEGVGKLKPASSDDALDIYKVDETKVYAGGHAVEENANITAATKKDSATMKLKTATNTEALTVLEDSTDTVNSGYYIDVPMWIRSSTNEADTNVYCTVTITDGKTESENLMKAVRVAIIPTQSGANSTDLAGTNEGSATTTWASDDTNTSNAKTLMAGATSATIFGLTGQETADTYHGKVISATGTYAVNSLGTTTVVKAADKLSDNTNFSKPTNDKDAATTPATAVFTLPKAEENDYAGCAFVARVWLEGESKYCEDATANQDWQIDFHFSLDNPTNAEGT